MKDRLSDVNLPVGQPLDKGQIRRGKRKISQLIRPYPSAGLVGNYPEGDPIPECPVGHQLDGDVIVVINPGSEIVADAGIHFQLLPEFAFQALLRGLSGFDLAAGKFPQSGQPIARVTLGDQDVAITDNDCSGDLNDGFHGADVPDPACQAGNKNKWMNKGIM